MRPVTVLVFARIGTVVSFAKEALGRQDMGLDQRIKRLDELLAKKAAAQTHGAPPSQRKRPSRKPFPEHLPRERVVIPAPACCPSCGSTKLSKLGEDVTETLEVIPRRWKVIQTVREKFSCRACETIAQPPAPFHATPRGFAGPNLLAMILFEKFGQHQPLNRQSERYAREGIDLSVSTSACRMPAKSFRWRRPPFITPRGTEGRSIPSAAVQALADQVGAYSGYNGLYDPGREQGAIVSALCWAHARRQFFELADIAANARRGKQAPAISPIALQAVKRIDALFDIERAINGLPADERLRVLQEQSAPLLADLKAWLGDERSRLSRSASVTKPIDYLLKRWDSFACFLNDGRICLSNNNAERALRGFALGRKSWLFAGSERGADRAAFMMTLITSAKLNSVDPLAWLADVLARIAGLPQSWLYELLPWNWQQPALQKAA